MKGFLRGNEVTWDGERWLREGVDAALCALQCPACSVEHWHEQPDACLGFIPRVAGACCGHGIHLGYINWENVGVGPEWQAGAFVGSA